MTARSVPVLLAAILIATSSSAIAAGRDSGTEASPLERLFADAAAERSETPEVGWRPGVGTVVWIDHRQAANPRLIEFDPGSGARRVLLEQRRLDELWGDRVGPPPILDDPVWRPDGRALLIDNGEHPCIADLGSDTLRVLESGPGPESHPTFSPDGDRVAWVRDHDLWLYELRSNRELRLTDDGSNTVFNGVFDWVYEEELADRDGRAYRWAPDGSAIVWLRLDDRAVPVHHLLDAMDVHTRVTEQRVPNPGDPAPVPSLHVVRIDPGPGDRDRLDLELERPSPYVPRFGLIPDGRLWYQRLDRAQDRLDLVLVDIDTGTATVLVSETDPFWVETVDGWQLLDDGSLLWPSRRTGFTHLYRIDADGAARDLTPDAGEVTGIIGVDPACRHAWVQVAHPTARDRRLLRVDLAAGVGTEITTGSGSHSADLAPDGGRLLVRSSSIESPPRWRVVNGRGGGAAEVPVELPLPPIDLVDHRFVDVTADDGVLLHALLLLPPGFDATRRYPVVVYTYGGPHAQVARDEWPGTSGLFNHVLAGRGLVVFALDNRGSAGRGRAFEGAIDHALGSSQLPDQLAGIRWLRSRPWVDGDRIGIWGWSYGGYMASLALTHAPGTFAAGVAVAPVTDWRLYDSIYTERYMGTPRDNPSGYAAGSVLDAVAGLADPLLVIHGTGDDNVHLQHTLQLADRAWREGVRFDLMLFPNLGHGIDEPGSRLEVFRAIADFFEEHLVTAGSDIVTSEPAVE